MSSLRSWWEELHFLAPDSRADLGNLIRQVERGLSAAPALSQPAQPAGWGGLSRRGSWPRLVTAEWALAEGAPEEFLRRACQGELTFWELAQEQQPQQRQLWVWVDTGPDQLGACRLVQMSLLLLFDHLCRKTGGFLVWGSIQKPDRGYEGFGPEEIRAFLRLRSLDPGRKPPDIGWANKMVDKSFAQANKMVDKSFAQANKMVDRSFAKANKMVDKSFAQVQVWCVGSPGWLTQVPAETHQIRLIQTSLESVELGYRQRKVDLRLPPTQRALRLLRDPLRSQPLISSSEVELQQPQALLFSPCGRKLLWVESGQVVVMPLPGGPFQAAGKARRFTLRRSGRVLAVAWQRKCLYVAQADQGQWLAYWQNPGDLSQDRYISVPAPLEASSAVGSIWPAPDGWNLWVDDQLWRLQAGQCQFRFSTRGGEGLGRQALLIPQDRSVVIDEEERLIQELPPEPFRHLWLCQGWAKGLGPGANVLALALDADAYRLIWRDGSARVNSSGLVLGVAFSPVRQQPALVVQQQEEFHLLGPDWTETLGAGSRILQAALHRDGLLAYRTSAGLIRCYSISRGCTLWQGQI